MGKGWMDFENCYGEHARGQKKITTNNIITLLVTKWNIPVRFVKLIM